MSFENLELLNLHVNILCENDHDLPHILTHLFVIPQISSTTDILFRSLHSPNDITTVAII